MFLNQLNESNKENFLKLCVYASLANGVFAKEEKDTLYAYCREMDVEEHIPETAETLEEIIKTINENTQKSEKNIIILEILALVKSDNIFDDKEQEFMKEVVNGLGLADSCIDKYNELLNKYIEIGRELFLAITN